MGQRPTPSIGDGPPKAPWGQRRPGAMIPDHLGKGRAEGAPAAAARDAAPFGTATIGFVFSPQSIMRNRASPSDPPALLITGRRGGAGQCCVGQYACNGFTGLVCRDGSCNGVAACLSKRHRGVVRMHRTGGLQLRRRRRRLRRGDTQLLPRHLRLWAHGALWGKHGGHARQLLRGQGLLEGRKILGDCQINERLLHRGFRLALRDGQQSR